MTDWKTPLKWSLLTLLLAYVGVMLVWSKAEAHRHQCKGIEIEIDGTGQVASISKESVLEVLQGYKGKILGAPLHTINTLEIANFLRKYNNFESVDCILTTQGNLKVRVVPMMPALRVFDGDNGYYVNKDGKRMAALPGFHVDVPLVTGRFTDRFRPESLIPIVRFIEQDSLLKSLTGMIVANDPENVIIVPRIKGHVINLGDASRLDEKRDAIITAYKSILPYKGWETYDTISVKYRGQIIATRRDKTPRFPTVEIEETEDLEESALHMATQAMQTEAAAQEQKPAVTPGANTGASTGGTPVAKPAANNAGAAPRPAVNTATKPAVNAANQTKKEKKTETRDIYEE